MTPNTRAALAALITAVVTASGALALSLLDEPVPVECPVCPVVEVVAPVEPAAGPATEPAPVTPAEEE